MVGCEVNDEGREAERCGGGVERRHRSQHEPFNRWAIWFVEQFSSVAGPVWAESLGFGLMKEGDQV